MQDKEPDNADFRRTAELKGQMEKIGGRFLDRVLAEVGAADAALEALRSGDASAVSTLEMFAHRVHGSSAIFGFAALSEAAGALEALLVSGQARENPASAVAGIAEGVAAVHAAARAARAGFSPG